MVPLKSDSWGFLTGHTQQDKVFYFETVTLSFTSLSHTCRRVRLISDVFISHWLHILITDIMQS